MQVEEVMQEVMQVEENRPGKKNKCKRPEAETIRKSDTRRDW